MRKLALNRKQVGRGAIISFGPDVCVAAGIDQRSVDAKPIARALDRAFHNVSDAELATDLPHVAFGARFVLADTGVADHS